MSLGVIFVIVGAIFAIITLFLLWRIEVIIFPDTIDIVIMIISLLIALTFLGLTILYENTDIIPHKEECICGYCYEYLGTESGIELFKNREDNMCYYNPSSKQYIEIVQFDNTPYTYEEYMIKHTNELEDKINDLFGQ